MNKSEQIQERTIRFFRRYGPELEQIRDLLVIKLRQMALAYTINNKLPRDSIVVTGRVKSLDSFLKKLKRHNWPSFYYPTDAVKDLIGARIVCWFIDDCYGIFDCIKKSSHFKVSHDPECQPKDYIKAPQMAGYRAIHLFAETTYDSVQRSGEEGVTLTPENILCELQIRTKLQDAWADITHEFFYKARDAGVSNPQYETFLADISSRLALEDTTFMKFRDAYQSLADSKDQKGLREGFKDGQPIKPTKAGKAKKKA